MAQIQTLELQSARNKTSEGFRGYEVEHESSMPWCKGRDYTISALKKKRT